MGNQACKSKNPKTSLLFEPSHENHAKNIIIKEIKQQNTPRKNQNTQQILNKNIFISDKNVINFLKINENKDKYEADPQTLSPEIQEFLNFHKAYTINKSLFEINRPITTLENYHCTQLPEKTASNRKTFKEKLEISMHKRDYQSKSFRELFINEESLYIPHKQHDSLYKSIKDTKNSTPCFEKPSEINELLPYLQPCNLQYSPEEKPRKFTIQKAQCEAIGRKSQDSLPSNTIQEYSLDEQENSSAAQQKNNKLKGNTSLYKYDDSYEEENYESEEKALQRENDSSSEEPQHIHINLFDLLQNELKTRRNSLSGKESPPKKQTKNTAIYRNDSQSSFKTLKKTDYLTPLQKNVLRYSKEKLNLSKKP